MTETVTDALSASVIAIDGSRRVGWARAYAAKEQADDLARDLNIARGDLAAATKFAGFLYGLITAIAPQLIQEFRSDHAGIMTFLPARSLSAGQQLGRRSTRPRKRNTATQPAPRPADQPPWQTPENFDPARAWKLIQKLRADLLALTPDVPDEPTPDNLGHDEAWNLIQNLRTERRAVKLDTLNHHR